MPWHQRCHKPQVAGTALNEPGNARQHATEDETHPTALAERAHPEAPDPRDGVHEVGFVRRAELGRARVRHDRDGALFGFVRLDRVERSLAQTAIDAFVTVDVDRVVLVYNEFRSVMTQRVVVDQLLPIARADVDGAGSATEIQIDYLYEPSPQEIFNQLLPRYVEVQVYRALLESNAAFFAAQMTAMDTATKNSGEMIANLTLYMNKVRQAAITREIIEVVSGAEAL